MAKESPGKKKKRAVYEKVLGISPELLSEARSAGVDERTIQSYVSKQNKLIDDVIGRSGLFSMAYAASLTEQRIPQDRRAEVKKEIAIQPELQAIREKRKSAVEERVAAMTRKRGKASLISSPAGGAGFFQRYFG